MNIEVLNVFFAVTGLFFFLAIFARQTRRGLGFWRERRQHGIPIPGIFIRDVVLFGAFTVLFVVGRLLRIFDEHLGTNVAWVLFSGIVGVGALAFYAYYEYFRIEK